MKVAHVGTGDTFIGDIHIGQAVGIIMDEGTKITMVTNDIHIGHIDRLGLDMLRLPDCYTQRQAAKIFKIRSHEVRSDKSGNWLNSKTGQTLKRRKK